MLLPRRSRCKFYFIYSRPMSMFSLNMSQNSSNFSWLDHVNQSAEIMLMRQQGMPISRDLAYPLVHECSRQQNLELGKGVQSLMIESGLHSVSALADHLLPIFASSGRMVEANYVFDKVSNPSQYTWTAIVDAHSQVGNNELAIQLYHNMQNEGQIPENFILSNILKACGKIDAIGQGRQIHQEMIETGFQSDVVVDSALVDMYAKCGKLEEAHRVFDVVHDRNVVTWGAMIAGYAQHGEMTLAVEYFEKMQQDGMEPNAVIWCAIIGGYAQLGEGYLALKYFNDMQHKHVKPDVPIFSCVLKACTHIGAIDQGMSIHKQIVEAGLDSDIVVGSALVHMYAKCGKLEEAHKLFTRLPARNMVTWTALIAGYTQYGNFQQAVHCLKGMEKEGIVPDSSAFSIILAAYSSMGKEGIVPDSWAFSIILAAYSSLGLLDEGCKYFISMSKEHGIMPDVSHFNCMVDLLGRTGRLSEAYNLLQTLEANSVGWTSLLTACRTYGNLELGKQCFEQVVALDPLSSSSSNMLISGIYADAYMKPNVSWIEKPSQKVCALKKPGTSGTEVDKKVHEFGVVDKCQAQNEDKEDVYSVLKKLSGRMKAAGYVPKVDLVLQRGSYEEKEFALLTHCEKLAIAFGISSTAPGTTIRVTKNLRVCADCHNATKIISTIEKREIIIKDAYRMHHFKDGSCSCGDYY